MKGFPAALEQWGRPQSATLPLYGKRAKRAARPGPAQAVAEPGVASREDELEAECASLRAALEAERAARALADAAQEAGLADVLAARMSATLEDMRQTIRADVAAVLEHLLEGVAQRRALAAFEELLAGLTGGVDGALRIEGPARLLAAVKEAAAARGLRLEAADTSATELRLHLGRNRISTAIEAWRAFLAEAAP